MKYFLTFLLFTILSCNSQSQTSMKTPIQFETVNIFPYPIIKGDFQVLEKQKKIDAVYAIIHSKTEGNRLAPIPSYSAEETYVVIKSSLKNKNSVEIKTISLQDKTLNVDLQEINDEQINPNNRIPPYVLVKVLDKVSANKINIQSIK